MDDSIKGVILGHNQFFGISHLSSQRAAEREQKFRQPGQVVDIIRAAQEHGASGLMLSTHERVRAIADRIRSDSGLKDGMEVHVLLPYMAKYVRAANTVGILGMVSDIIGQSDWSSRLRLGLTSGKALLRGDHLEKLKALIDVEMLPFKGLNVKTVFLHNALTDLGVGLGMRDVFAFFCDYIKDRYGATPCLCTLSSSLVMRRLEAWDLCVPLMAPFNTIGYQMNPSRETCEADLAKYPCPVVAMSPLAAGAASPEVAAAYLRQMKFGSVVVGASSRAHVAHTFSLFGEALEA